MHAKSTTLSVVERREYVRERYRLDGEAAVSEALGVSRKAVKNMAWRLGLLRPMSYWTPEQDATILEWYARPVHSAGFLYELADLLGRTRIAVALRASRLGMTNWNAKKVPWTRAERDRAKYRSEAKYTPDERSRLISERTKRWIAENGHPRGALGMKHTPETKAKMVAAVRRAWADPNSRFNSEEHRQYLSDRGVRMVKEGLFVSGEQMYSRAAQGRREDLGNQYFRSSWEANYARYLNLLISQGHIVSWEYEKHTFWFEAIRRGVRSYTPDFRVLYPDGHHEWHEVKGWMDTKSVTKLKRMKKYHPAEVMRVIDKEWFANATRSGLPGVIAGWERKR